MMLSAEWCVMEAVSNALGKYNAENVDAVLNEETGMVDIIYHGDNNSFPIETSVAKMKFIDKQRLAAELDKWNVGHCW